MHLGLHIPIHSSLFKNPTPLFNLTRGTKSFIFMDDSNALNIQWGSFETTVPITPDVGLEIEVTSSGITDQAHEASKEEIGANDFTSPKSLIIPHHDSIKQEIDTKVFPFVEDSSISNIQWGSIDSSILVALDKGLEIASTSSIDQPYEASKDQLEVNDITFPSKYSM